MIIKAFKTYMTCVWHPTQRTAISGECCNNLYWPG